MREIVLDTETTGFDPENGDKIVEIGAVELVRHMASSKTYHQYINPERDMPDGAFSVHGIGPDLLTTPRAAKPGEVTLKDKPVFKKIARDFLDFIGTDSKLIIHNAPFDMKFLNAELSRAGFDQISPDRAIDTLMIARRKFPGAPASLDALCRRFSIDNSNRTLHGALLDSEILAEVYLELIGGKQPNFNLEVTSKAVSKATSETVWRAQPRANPLSSRLTEKEKAAHAAFVDSIGENAIWSKMKG